MLYFIRKKYNRNTIFIIRKNKNKIKINLYNYTLYFKDPILFVGTIRENLDPFKKYDDHVIWKSLTEVVIHIL